MTPEQTKQLLPILKAYSEGKTIQYKHGNTWRDAEQLQFTNYPEYYRIKPKTIKYRSYIISFGEDFMVRGIVTKEDKSLAQQEETIESIAGFIKWIDKDWVEIECPI